MQDKDFVSVMAVENTTGRLDYLAIAGVPEFLRAAAAVRMVGKLLNVVEDAFDKLRRCDRIFQRYVVSNCINIRQRGL
jgi:hypothetical protein